MSQQYPDLAYTNFPDSIDTMNNFIDISLDMIPLAKEYYAKYNSGDIVGANRVIENNPQLKYSQISAGTLNPIVDAVKALERFYMSDVQNYLMNIVVYKGEYSASTKYTKYNTVRYVNNSAFETYMCISNSTPIGSLPTDTSYWIPLTLRGERGDAGVGLVAFGDWDSVTRYPKDALVAHNNALWGSKVENTAIAPSTTATTTWYKVIDFSSEFANYKDNTTMKNYKLSVNNSKIYLENKENSGDKLDIALKSDLVAPTKLVQIDSRSTNENPSYYFRTHSNGVIEELKSTSVIGLGGSTLVPVITVTPWVDSSGGYPTQYATYNDTTYRRTGTSDTTWGTWKNIIPASLPANGGNSDTVDGFHITTQTTIPSSLADNVICMVYE